MQKPRLKMRLGDLLVAEGILSEQQITDALSKQKETRRKLGATLIQLGMITETQLLKFLSHQLNLPFLDLSQRPVKAKIVQILPEVQARRHRAIVIDDLGEKLLLGMSDPADLAALDALANILPKDFDLAVVSESQILEAFDQLYRKTADIASFAEQLKEEFQDSDDLASNAFEDAEGGEEATVAKLLQSIFEDAIQVRASDIHIEPDENMLRIRLRVDGVLQESEFPEANIAPALVLRLKLMSSLDISEKRMPQDGRFNIRFKGHNIDVRLSTMPVQYGESVVMRLLDQSAGLISLEKTGMPAVMLERFRKNIRRPHGMVLVTGPTGSGKTTTLYGALSELNEPGKKIITAEDPVEYRLPRISQVQVNPKIHLTFSQVLRTVLRQDPDIIMVGEMRDQETAEIGLRGALTGHLVLSTLHTNDAVTSVLRLVDMGAQPYLVASALRMVIAQRLVRKICDNCKVTKPIENQDLFWLETISEKALHEVEFYKGKGCQSCNYTGYKGRMGVFELLELDENMMAALRREDSEGFTEAARENKYYKPLSLVALDYAIQGLTSVDEVLRLVEQVGEQLEEELTDESSASEESSLDE
jgi:MSHA biogenesis protein MshE